MNSILDCYCLSFKNGIIVAYMVPDQLQKLITVNVVVNTLFNLFL